jgi:hypothetical protein
MFSMSRPFHRHPVVKPRTRTGTSPADPLSARQRRSPTTIWNPPPDRADDDRLHEAAV